MAPRVLGTALSDFGHRDEKGALDIAIASVYINGDSPKDCEEKKLFWFHFRLFQTPLPKNPIKQPPVTFGVPSYGYVKSKVFRTVSLLAPYQTN